MLGIIGVGWSNANAAGFNRNNGSLRQFNAIPRYDLSAHSTLLARGNVNQSRDAVVRQATSDCQFAEVLVESDEDSLLPVCLG